MGESEKQADAFINSWLFVRWVRRSSGPAVQCGGAVRGRSVRGRSRAGRSSGSGPAAWWSQSFGGPPLLSPSPVPGEPILDALWPTSNITKRGGSPLSANPWFRQATPQTLVLVWATTLTPHSGSGQYHPRGDDGQRVAQQSRTGEDPPEWETRSSPRLSQCVKDTKADPLHDRPCSTKQSVECHVTLQSSTVTTLLSVTIQRKMLTNKSPSAHPEIHRT